MGEEPINGECLACQTNSRFDYIENKCVCDEGFFYDAGASQCSQCSEDCAKCESFDVCIECYEFYVIELGEEDSGAYCVPDSCQDGMYFDLTAKKCVDCHESCQTCSEDGSKCETCPKSYELGETICLQCRKSQTTVGDECVDCGAGCLECDNPATCNVCEANAILVNDEC